MTRWCFDTEFDEDGRTIELISIGLVSDEGHEYYAVSREFDPLHCNEWVQQHVLTKLPPAGDKLWKPRSQIRDEVFALIQSGRTAPKFWAYYADYDWVVFCQLWGRMVDLPPEFPRHCLDLKQRLDGLGERLTDLPAQPEAAAHHALADARWVEEVMRELDRIYAG